MPRARKTQSGQPAMSVSQIPGQQYGKGVEQTRLQQAMPAPKDQTAKVAAQAAATTAPAQAPQQAAPRGPSDPMAAALALRDRVGLLANPTQRPNEPVTAGLTRGMGPGPEVLGMVIGSPLGRTMRDIARQSGDPYLARLADEAGL